MMVVWFLCSCFDLNVKTHGPDISGFVCSYYLTADLYLHIYTSHLPFFFLRFLYLPQCLFLYIGAGIQIKHTGPYRYSVKKTSSATALRKLVIAEPVEF